MITDETIRRVLKFRDDRDWRQFHTPKDLAISLNLECAELLELFQWSGADLECRDKLPAMREELADVAACFNGPAKDMRPARRTPGGYERWIIF